MRLISEIPSVTNLAITAAFNAKINKLKNKISNINDIATFTALTTVENKIPSHSKYITTPEFNKLTVDYQLKNLNKNVTSNKAKHVLVENELNEQSKKVEAISTKGLTKDLINGYKILMAQQVFFFRNNL